MNIVDDKYKIKLSPLKRNLLLSALSTCRFTLLHADHPFSVMITENNLINKDHLTSLFSVIKNADDQETVELTLEDEILFYTALNITCKTFLTDIADDLKEKSGDLLEISGANFSEVRNTLLRSCQFVMEGLRSTFNNNDQFMDRVVLLDTILNVD